MKHFWVWESEIGEECRQGWAWIFGGGWAWNPGKNKAQQFVEKIRHQISLRNLPAILLKFPRPKSKIHPKSALQNLTLNNVSLFESVPEIAAISGLRWKFAIAIAKIARSRYTPWPSNPLFFLAFLSFPFIFFCFRAFCLSFPRILGVPWRQKPLFFSGVSLAFFFFKKKKRVGGPELRYWTSYVSLRLLPGQSLFAMLPVCTVCGQPQALDMVLEDRVRAHLRAPPFKTKSFTIAAEVITKLIKLNSIMF